MHYTLDTIKIIRKKLGLTQSQLAKKANVSQSLIAKIEAGKLDPTFSKAKEIFDTLSRLTSKTSYCARDIMQTKIITADINERVDIIIQKMNKHNISQLPVLKKYVVGLISEASILEKVSSGANLKDLTAEDVMAESAPMVSENMDLETLNSILKQHPMIIVSKHGELTGVITKADILKNIYKV